MPLGSAPAAVAWLTSFKRTKSSEQDSFYRWNSKQPHLSKIDSVSSNNGPGTPFVHPRGADSCRRCRRIRADQEQAQSDCGHCSRSPVWPRRLPHRQQRALRRRAESSRLHCPGRVCVPPRHPTSQAGTHNAVLVCRVRAGYLWRRIPPYLVTNENSRVLAGVRVRQEEKEIS